jgi:hypothetical protein
MSPEPQDPSAVWLTLMLFGMLASYMAGCAKREANRSIRRKNRFFNTHNK